MGPPGMPSLGGMLPITGLGAAAALWRTEEEEEDHSLATEIKRYSRKQREKTRKLMARQLFNGTEKSFVDVSELFFFFAVKQFVWEEISNLQKVLSVRRGAASGAPKHRRVEKRQ